MLVIDTDELARAPKLGKTIICLMCGKRHRIKYGKRVLNDGTSIPDNTIAFYKCRNELYLAGLHGKDIRK